MTTSISEWIGDKGNSQHVMHTYKCITYGKESTTIMSQCLMTEPQLHIFSGVACITHIMWDVNP
jgi:hypothetical protein